MGFAARLALLFAVTLTTVGAAREEPLSQLLDRMRTRSGPVWRAHLGSTSVLMSGEQSTSVHSDSQGLRFSTYQCAQTLCTGTYFDGERVFSININGTALPESDFRDEFLRAERTIASHVFLDPAFEDNGGSIADDGSATIDGTRYRLLLVSNPDAVPIEVYVDPSTALVRYLHDVNGDATIEYRDYRHVDGGFTLPYLVLRNGNVLERYESRSVQDGTFNEPRGLLPVFSGTPAPLSTDPGRSIPVFPCSIAHVETTCLLDTGNSGLSLSSELAEQLGAPVVGQMQVAGLGSYATQVVRMGPLEVGNATFPAANYDVLNDIHRFGYDVVLGADVLAATRVELSPSDHRITFSARATGVAAAPKTISIPLHFQDFVPIIAVQLGALGAQLAVDTGDESTINLSYDFYSEHRDLFATTEQRTVTGIGGSSVELIGQIPEVRIGGLDVRNQRIGTTTTLHSTAYGHLGAGFLSQFTVLIDYARGRVQFSPPARSVVPQRR